MKEPKFEKPEMEPCECGHDAPIGFIVYDKNGCGTCMPCHIEYLNDVIKKSIYRKDKMKANYRKHQILLAEKEASLKMVYRERDEFKDELELFVRKYNALKASACMKKI
jgi:hypothetical protein